VRGRSGKAIGSARLCTFICARRARQFL